MQAGSKRGKNGEQLFGECMGFFMGKACVPRQVITYQEDLFLSMSVSGGQGLTIRRTKMVNAIPTKRP